MYMLHVVHVHVKYRVPDALDINLRILLCGCPCLCRVWPGMSASVGRFQIGIADVLVERTSGLQFRPVPEGCAV